MNANRYGIVNRHLSVDDYIAPHTSIPIYYLNTLADSYAVISGNRVIYRVHPYSMLIYAIGYLNKHHLLRRDTI